MIKFVNRKRERLLLKEKFDFFVLIGFIVIFTTSFYFISKKEN